MNDEHIDTFEWERLQTYTTCLQAVTNLDVSDINYKN